MVNKADSNKARLRRHKRVRGKISGTAERPRLNVFRSSANIYAQIIDDTTGHTLCAPWWSVPVSGTFAPRPCVPTTPATWSALP